MRLKLIIDTNILMAALIKDGITRKLLLHEDIAPFVIDYIIDEMKRYEKDIIEKSGKDGETITFILKTILSKSKVIEMDSMGHNLKRAEVLIGKIDQSDRRDPTASRWGMPHSVTTFQIGVAASSGVSNPIWK